MENIAILSRRIVCSYTREACICHLQLRIEKELFINKCIILVRNTQRFKAVFIYHFEVSTVSNNTYAILHTYILQHAGLQRIISNVIPFS